MEQKKYAASFIQHFQVYPSVHVLSRSRGRKLEETTRNNHITKEGGACICNLCWQWKHLLFRGNVSGIMWWECLSCTTTWNDGTTIDQSYFFPFSPFKCCLLGFFIHFILSSHQSPFHNVTQWDFKQCPWHLAICFEITLLYISIKWNMPGNFEALMLCRPRFKSRWVTLYSIYKHKILG